jgi:hypothetical protein
LTSPAADRWLVKLKVKVRPDCVDVGEIWTSPDAAASGAAVATMTTGTVQALPLAMVRRSISQALPTDLSTASSLCIVPLQQAAGTDASRVGAKLAGNVRKTMVW